MTTLADLAKLPTSPGVYLMKGARGKVLYVGKAKNLRSRVRQYFAGSDERPMIPHLLREVRDIDTILVDSEKEALLLENTLIKQHKPKYNALFKDDKTYISLKITHKHAWPKIELVRYRGRAKSDGLYFGPYTSAHAARVTLELVQKLFPLRQCSDAELIRRTRPCILHEMQRCIAPCVGLCTKEEYDAHVDRAIRFLSGQDKSVVAMLKGEMERAVEKLEFERAAVIRDCLKDVERTVEKQKVEQAFGGDFDVFGLHREGSGVACCCMLYRGGRLVGAENDFFPESAEEDVDLLSSLVLQRYQGKERGVRELVLPYARDLELLQECVGLRISSPKRGAKRAQVEMAERNAKAHLARVFDRRTERERALLELQSQLKLDSFPAKIVCFDTSHLSGSAPVAAAVTFVEGEKAPKGYRLFHIKKAEGGDDYGAMLEVLERYFARTPPEELPNLLIVDGGKGQLTQAKRVIAAQNLTTVEAIALVKEGGRHDKGATLERVYLPSQRDAKSLRRNSSVLYLLQRIRDEAHRRAIAFHQKVRAKQTIRSKLEDIPGIGPVKRKKLLSTFGSVKRVQEATLEQLMQVQGITAKDAQNIKEMLASN